MTLLALLACSPTSPPARPPPPEPAGPVAIDLKLTCPIPQGSHAVSRLAEGGPAVPTHPEAGPDTIGAWVQSSPEDRRALALEPGPDGWTASVDIDGDGTISDSERLPIHSEDSDAPTDAFPAFELPAVDSRGEATTWALRVAVRPHHIDPTIRIVEIAQGCKGGGTLPDGRPFAIHSPTGILQHPLTELSFDVDGDGDLDLDNRLASISLAEGIVPVGGRNHRFEVTSDPPRLLLEPSDEPLAGLRAGAPAPSFSEVGTDGELHTLDRYAGKPLLLDFWATWCGPCVDLHPEVVALAEEYDIAVLGISADDDNAVIERWLRTHPTPWPSVAVGPEGEVNQAYGVSSWPTHALIDAEGRLVVLGRLSAVRPALEAVVQQAPAKAEHPSPDQ